MREREDTQLARVRENSSYRRSALEVNPIHLVYRHFKKGNREAANELHSEVAHLTHGVRKRLIRNFYETCDGRRSR